jgi:hypothetical protein
MGTTRRKLDPPDAFLDGRPCWYCYGPAHDAPRLLPKSEWTFVERTMSSGEKYWYRRKTCMRCRYVRDAANRPNFGFTVSGSVSLYRMEPYLHELEARCGSVRKAAKYLNVAPCQVLWWQRRARHQGRYLEVMRKQTAVRILQALREKRAEQLGLTIEYAPTYNAAPMRIRRCAGCGCAQDDYREGCRTCEDRKRRRKERGATRDRRVNPE